MREIFLIGLVEALFLAILIFSKKNKTVPDFVLAVWMLFIGLHLLFYYFHHTKLNLQYPHLLGIDAFFPMLQGVFLFVYVSVLMDEKGKLSTSKLIHIIPFLILTIYGVFDFYLLGADAKLEYYHLIEESPPIVYSIAFVLNVIVGPLYVIWSLFLIKKHRNNIANKFSYTEQINLNWLKYVIVSMGLIWVIVIITTIISDILVIFPVDLSSDIIYISVAIAVFLIGFFGFRQQSIYTNVSIESARSAIGQHAENEKNRPAKIKVESFISQAERYGKSGLKDPDSEIFIKKLLQFMDKEKPFLNNKLSLKMLAESLDLSTNHLSQIINEKLDRNFYDFINEYRITEVKRYLSDPKYGHYTLLAIAYDCGFNSKSSFNSLFKQNTGLTPSEFQKSITS